MGIGISIVIPTYGRSQQLQACLQALTHLDYPRDAFDVIVVDDGSDTPPDSAIGPFRERLDLTLLAQEHAGPAAARNAGAARAKGRFLAFTDDDCSPDRLWLQILAAHFALNPDRALGGRTINALPRNLYSCASQDLVSYLYAYYNANHDQARFFASNNLALPADSFRHIGGFDETFPFAAGEDRDLCDRWVSCGYPMAYVPEAIVRHAHPLSIRSFWRQQFNYGRGAYYFHKKRGRRSQTPPVNVVALEPRAFYLNLLFYPLAQARSLNAKALAAFLAVLSQAAIAAGFGWESRKRSHG